MIPTPENIAKLKKKKLEASKAKIHNKISNTFIESAIQRNSVGALKTIYYIGSAVEKIANLNDLEEDSLIKLQFDTREMLKYTEMTLPEIKRNIKAMQRTSITYTDEKNNTETGVSLLPYYKFIYGKHKVEVKIFVKIAKQIIDVKRNYSMIDTKSLMQLKSKHSIKMLPLLYRISQYDKDGEPLPKRKIMTLGELNAFFGTNYKRLTDLDKFVLQGVKEELDEKSKITFVYETNYDYFDAGRPKAISITIDVIDKTPPKPKKKQGSLPIKTKVDKGYAKLIGKHIKAKEGEIIMEKKIEAIEPYDNFLKIWLDIGSVKVKNLDELKSIIID